MNEFILETFPECWYRCKVCGRGRPQRAFPKKKRGLSTYLNLHPKFNVCNDCRKELKEGKRIYEPDIEISQGYMKC